MDGWLVDAGTETVYPLLLLSSSSTPPADAYAYCEWSPSDAKRGGGGKLRLLHKSRALNLVTGKRLRGRRQPPPLRRSAV